MVGLVACEQVVMADVVDMVEIVGRRHAGKELELFVEMGMVGETEPVDDGSEVVAVHLLDNLRGGQAAFGAHHLFGSHAYIVEEYSPQLPFAQTGFVCKCVKGGGRVDVDFVAYAYQAFQVGRVVMQGQLPIDEIFNHLDGRERVLGFDYPPFEQLERCGAEVVQIGVAVLKQITGNACNHLLGVWLEEDEYEVCVSLHPDVGGRKQLAAYGGPAAWVEDSVDGKGGSPMEHPFHAAYGHDIQFYADTVRLHHPVVMDKGTEGLRGEDDF